MKRGAIHSGCLSSRMPVGGPIGGFSPTTLSCHLSALTQLSLGLADEEGKDGMDWLGWAWLAGQEA